MAPFRVKSAALWLVLAACGGHSAGTHDASGADSMTPGDGALDAALDGAVDAAVSGLGFEAHLSLLGALLAGSLFFAPWATAAALKISLE